jgi:uncharacterized protein (DUF2267 family)
MNYQDMMRTVAGRTGLTRRGADQAVLGTLTVLAECVSAPETRDLVAQLPKSLRERVPVSDATVEMRPIEFVARVADLNENESLEDTETQVRAVFATLTEAVNRGEMNDIAAELGNGFDDLLGRPSHRPRRPPQEALAPVPEVVPLPEDSPTAVRDTIAASPPAETPVQSSSPATFVTAAVRATLAVPRALLGLARLPFSAAARIGPFDRR